MASRGGQASGGQAGGGERENGRPVYATAREAGLARDGGESQLTDELLGVVVAAVRPDRPAGHGASWEVLARRKEQVTGWVKDGPTLVKM